MNDIKLRRIAMQAMLPGLEMSVEHSLELLNSARSALSLPPLVLAEGEPVAALSPPARRGRPPLALSAANMAPVAPPNGKRPYHRKNPQNESEAERIARRVAQNKAAQQRYLERKRQRLAAEQTGAQIPPLGPRHMTPVAKSRLGSHTAERWRVIKEAGLNSHGKLPSNELFDKGKKILERRAHEAAKRETQQ